MIRLTRLNNQPLAINSDLIKFIESAPDSVITLIGGEKLVVKEKVDQIIAAVVAFRRLLLEGLPLAAAEARLVVHAPAPSAECAGDNDRNKSSLPEGHRG